MTLTLSAKTVDGKTLPLPAPLLLDCREDRAIPCASLEAAFPLNATLESAEFCEVAAALEGKPIFEGIVDRQITEKSGAGLLLRLESRSKTALLLDNEVKPYIYFQLTSSQLFERYGRVNGLLGAKFPYEARRSYLQVNKGSSAWNVLEQFCRVVYRKQPFITRERILVLEPETGITRMLSNRRKDGIPYTGLTVRRKNDKVISKLYMKTATETYGSYYGLIFENGEATRRNIRRERYYHPGNAVVEDQKDETRRIIQQSNRDGFEIEVTLPGIRAAEPGDRASLPDEAIRQALTVAGVRYRVNESGATTTLLLQYLLE